MNCLKSGIHYWDNNIAQQISATQTIIKAQLIILIYLLSNNLLMVLMQKNRTEKTEPFFAQPFSLVSETYLVNAKASASFISPAVHSYQRKHCNLYRFISGVSSFCVSHQMWEIKECNESAIRELVSQSNCAFTQD